MEKDDFSDPAGVATFIPVISIAIENAGFSREPVQSIIPADPDLCEGAITAG